MPSLRNKNIVKPDFTAALFRRLDQHDVPVLAGLIAVVAVVEQLRA
jgi:hypothetical protein